MPPRHDEQLDELHVIAYNGRFNLVYAWTKKKAVENLRKGEAYMGTLREVKRSHPCIYNDFVKKHLID